VKARTDQKNQDTSHNACAGEQLIHSENSSGLMIAALLALLARREALGPKLTTSGYLLSLVALQSLHFYLAQFSPLTAALL
jgi:hypothetical protein